MSETLLQRYAALLEQSEHMLAAARVSDWEGLQRIEARCERMIDEVRAQARAEALSPEAERTKLRILRAIVTVDREVRYLAQPWERELEDMLSGRLVARGPT